MMSKKSEAELNQIIANSKSFVKEARQAAIWELEKRNLKLYENIDSKQITYPKPPISPQKRSEPIINQNEKYITTYKDAPELYTKKAIVVFSLLFSTIFGAALLMSNLKTLNYKKARIGALIFGFIYTLLIIIVGIQINQSRYFF